MTNKEFGSILAHVRRSLGFTQVQLAKKSGLHRTFISNIEKGERNITLETIAKLSLALQISPGELFSNGTQHLETKMTPSEVTFLKVGGTWDMVATNDGLRGTGKLDDAALARIEVAQSFDENKIRDALDKEFMETEPIKKDIASHLFWVKGLAQLIQGEFYPLFSGDGSNFRSSMLSVIIAHLLRVVARNTQKQVVVGAGTDTTDILLPFLDVFLFDSNALPILVSGANRSHRETHSDAPQNFHDLALATHLPLMPGAYYIFNRTTYKGGDLVKIDPSEEPSTLEGMITFFAPQRTQTKIGYIQAHSRNQKVKTLIPLYSSQKIFEALSMIVTVDLGDNNPIEHEVGKILDPRFPGVIIKSHALGNASNPIRRATLDAVKQGKLVINISRCLIGNTSDRYYVSLSSMNRREVARGTRKILEGGKLNHGAAYALLTRALLEKRNQKRTQELIDAYSKRTF